MSCGRSRTKLLAGLKLSGLEPLCDSLSAEPPSVADLPTRNLPGSCLQSYGHGVDPEDLRDFACRQYVVVFVILIGLYSR